LACRGARSGVNEWTMEYEKPGSFEEHQDKFKGMT
jgi:hypothetical protein